MLAEAPASMIPPSVAPINAQLLHSCVPPTWHPSSMTHRKFRACPHRAAGCTGSRNYHRKGQGIGDVCRAWRGPLRVANVRDALTESRASWCVNTSTEGGALYNKLVAAPAANTRQAAKASYFERQARYDSQSLDASPEAAPTPPAPHEAVIDRVRERHTSCGHRPCIFGRNQSSFPRMQSTLMRPSRHALRLSLCCAQPRCV